MGSCGMHFQSLCMIILLMIMIRILTLEHILHEKMKQRISQRKHLSTIMENGHLKTSTEAEDQS
jgi:hypothetical protein